MLVGGGVMIEMLYRLQLGERTGCDLQLPRHDARHADSLRSWLGARRAALAGFAAFEFMRRRFVRGWGSDLKARSRAENRAEGGRAMSGVYAVELKDLRKSFGKTEIIRGTDLGCRPGERVAIIGPNGAGKSTLFNLISGRFGPTSGEILLNGERIDGLKPYEINRLGLARSFQITNIFPRLSVFENLRCARAVVARLPLCVLEVPRRSGRRQRARRCAAGDDQASTASATRWR